MSRTIDEIVAFHIGGVTLELCKQIKAVEDLKAEVEQLKVNAKPAKEKTNGLDRDSSKPG